MNKTLTLPEILGCIGRNLGNNDIISCMQVCRAWKIEFEPLLWRSFTLELIRRPRPEHSLLLKNAHHIRQLFISHMDPNLQDFFIQCSQLDEIHLSLRFLEKGDLEHMWGRFSEMIDNHSRLRKIVLKGVQRSLTNQILETIERCPKLIVLETEGIKYDNVITELIFRAFSKLKRLSSNADEYCSLQFPDELTFQEMRYLDIYNIGGMSMDMQLAWLSRCPNLISFRLESFNSINVNKLCSTLSAHTCPDLTALHLFVSLTDAEITRILGAVPRIEKLSLPNSEFGSQSFAALRKHFSTLRDISLQFCTNVTSAMVQEILSSCSHLQSISAEILSYNDIVRQAWVCTGLQMFDVGLSVDAEHGDPETRKTNSRAVYRRLAQLRNLTYLSICSDTQIENQMQDIIMITLEGGLGALETLKKITFFSCKTLLDDIHPTIGYQAVQWMLEHWRRLESFEATSLGLSRSRDFGKELKEQINGIDLLKDYGIKIAEYELQHVESDEWTENEYSEVSEDSEGEDYEHSADYDDFFVENY
ncbi:hypothetical protein FBU30_005212 [Linnemannia zychae]|nr:hypothetical protein FBU30_005212 [Linnemannia zychae]